MSAKSGELAASATKAPAYNPAKNFNESAGKVLSYKKKRSGLELTLDNAVVRLYWYSQNCLRVWIEKGDSFDRSPSYGVIAEPAGFRFELEERRNKLTMESKAIRVEIDRAAFRLRFYNKDSVLLNADDKSFGTSWLGQECTTYKSLQPDEKFIGLGEKVGNLNKRGAAYYNWNTDAFAYDEGRDPLYCTLPFYIGMHGDVHYGIFFDNSFKSRFNFGASNDRFSFFGAADGAMDYYFIHCDKTTETVKEYADLTGYMPMPPKWSLGFQQCRYSYYPDSRVLSTAQEFRDRKIPCDVIYLDIHYMDRYRVFTWDKERFPNPKRMISKLRKDGFRTALIVDPGVAKAKDYPVFTEGLEKDLYVKYPDGEPWTASVWPGPCHFPDFSKPAAREWWAGLFDQLAKVGVRGFWNDMNEPASWGQDNPDLTVFDFDGEGATHKEAHNLYGLLMSRATRDGADRSLSGEVEERPFVLTRAAYSGSQRYTAVWTGDNVSTDSHMLLGVRMVANMGLASIAYAGFDVGGFAGEPNPYLFARWMAVGAFTPLYRCHTMINSRDAEPWAFGEQVEDIARNYIELRYRLLPYIYSCMRSATTDGLPLVRALMLEWQNDPAVYETAYQNQFLCGPSLLVCPTESTRELVNIHLPSGDWYYLYDDELLADPDPASGRGQQLPYESPIDRLPVFVRAGAILPMQSVVQHTGEKGDGILHLHLYAGGSSSFDYYEDDGETYAFRNGQFLSRNLSFNGKQLKFSAAEGKYRSDYKKVRLYLHGFDKNEVRMNGKVLKTRKADCPMLNQLSHFDPWEWNEDKRKYIADLPYVDFSHSRGEMKLSVK